MRTSLEFCVTDLQGAKLAAKHGADRIELCVDLSIGGLTPSIGLIEHCSEIIETHVLVRPRGGDFTYNEEELSIIRADILQAHLAGATGIVFGCLNDKNELDKSANESILALSEQLGLFTTFHRAFDQLATIEDAIETLIDWEVGRVLTSGLADSAIEGIEVLEKLVVLSKGDIQIMAGGGVGPNNAKNLLDVGVHGLHCSIHEKKISTSAMGQRITYDFNKIDEMAALVKKEA